MIEKKAATNINPTYGQIWKISAPIMLGSAAQNIITLMDGIFLGRVGEVELGAIGFVGVFYLIIASIGYGFSKGGQIMIARRVGEQNNDAIGRTTYSMLYFELGLAVIMFLFMQFGAYYFFSATINSDAIFYKSLEYLNTRSYGVFFSYIGVAIIALYTGIARTNFIIVTTIILGVTNLVLNYGLIFGNFGLPEMGIAGAGLASTIAEIVAFFAFLIYMAFDKEIKKYNLFRLPKINFDEIKTMMRISFPIVAQFVVALGSWYLFFGIIENLGERELAASNVLRMVYLVLSIPCWGFSSGINTMVSNLIGQARIDMVFPVIRKTVYLCLGTTLLLSVPLVLLPDWIMAVFTPKMAVIDMARPVLPLLMVILVLFSIGTIMFNGLAGTGATFSGLKIQVVSAITYVSSIYLIIEYIGGELQMAWSSEILYWLVYIGYTYYLLYAKDWQGVKV